MGEDVLDSGVHRRINRAFERGVANIDAPAFVYASAVRRAKALAD